MAWVRSGTRRADRNHQRGGVLDRLEEGALVPHITHKDALSHDAEDCRVCLWSDIETEQQRQRNRPAKTVKHTGRVRETGRQRQGTEGTSALLHCLQPSSALAFVIFLTSPLTGTPLCFSRLYMREPVPPVAPVTNTGATGPSDIKPTTRAANTSITSRSFCVKRLFAENCFFVGMGKKVLFDSSEDELDTPEPGTPPTKDVEEPRSRQLRTMQLLACCSFNGLTIEALRPALDLARERRQLAPADVVQLLQLMGAPPALLTTDTQAAELFQPTDDHTNRIDACELLLSLLFLCQGSARNKLNFCFELCVQFDFEASAGLLPFQTAIMALE